MVTPRPLEGWSSEKRTYRQFSPEQKAEVVLAGLRGDRERAGRLWRAPERRDAVRPVARSAAGRRQAALANPRGKTPEQAELDRLTARWASSSGPWAGGPTSRRSRGNPLRAGVSVHVAQSRVVVAAGSQPAVVARVAGVCRQTLYRRRSRRPGAAGRGRTGRDDQVIVNVARAKCDRRHPHGGGAGWSRARPGRSTASARSGRCGPIGCCSRHDRPAPARVSA
jgi:transposase